MSANPLAPMLFGPLPLPPPKLTSYRYWEGRPADELRAVRAKLDLVLDDMTRQFDLFAIPEEGAPVPSQSVALLSRNAVVEEIFAPSIA